MPIFTADNHDVRGYLPFLVLVLAGCSTTRKGVPPMAGNGPHPSYRLACPDVLEVSFPGSPSRDLVAAVDIDGKLPAPLGAARVEGMTVSEARLAIAASTEVSTDEVVVKLIEPKAKTLVVSGPDNKRARFLPYTGPEPVLDFLRRTETIPPGESKLNRVYVLRSNVAGGTPPRLFHVDVEAVLLDNDHATNLPLEPGDHIYIGETRRSTLGRLLPDWAKPLYRKLVGLLPDSLR